MVRAHNVVTLTGVCVTVCVSELVQKVTANERVVNGAKQPAAASATKAAAAAAPPVLGAEPVRPEASEGHTAPRKLSSDPEVLKARAQAVSRGLVTLLEQAGVEASTTQLAAGATFCESEGARSVQEVARYGKVSGLVAALGLKPIPQGEGARGAGGVGAAGTHEGSDGRGESRLVLPRDVMHVFWQLMSALRFYERAEVTYNGGNGGVSRGADA